MELRLVDQQTDVIILILLLNVLSTLKFTENFFLFLDNLLLLNDFRLQDLYLVVDLSSDALLYISDDLDSVCTLDCQLLMMVVFYKASRVGLDRATCMISLSSSGEL